MTWSEEETYEEVTESGLIVVRGRAADAVEGQSFIVDTDAVLPTLPSEYRIWMPQDARIIGTTAIAGEDRSQTRPRLPLHISSLSMTDGSADSAWMGVA